MRSIERDDADGSREGGRFYCYLEKPRAILFLIEKALYTKIDRAMIHFIDNPVFSNY